MIAGIPLLAVLLFAPPAATPAEPEVSSRVVSDGPVAVTARVTPDPSYIGDIVQLEVVAAFPKNVSVNLPIGLSFDPLHLVGIEEAPPEATGEGLRKTFAIKLQYFDVGTAKIPGFPVTWVDDSGEVHTLEVPAHTFEVEALLANEADPTRRDEDPPISITYPNTTAEIVIYAAFGTLVFAFFAWLFGRRYFGRPKPVYVPPPIPPHKVALSALEELAKGDLVAGGRFTDYYLELTQIAKGYIEGRFGLEALDRTTEEIRRELVRRPKIIEPLSADEVIAFLQQCDLVKFARFAPPVAEAEGALTEVRGMVHASLPTDAEVEVPNRAPDEAAEAPEPVAPDDEARAREAAVTVQDGGSPPEDADDEGSADAPMHTTRDMAAGTEPEDPS